MGRAVVDSNQPAFEKRSYQDSGPSMAKTPSALNSKELAAMIRNMARSSISVRFAEK
jgi:hypothetical protein